MKEEVMLVVEKLEELGHSLSSAGEEALAFIYPIALRQAYLRGLLGIIMAILVILSLPIAYKVYKKMASIRDKMDYENEGIMTVCIGVLGYMYSLLVFLIVVDFYNSVLQLLNPEWYAIQNILGLF